MLALRSILFALLCPGTVTVLVPYLLLRAAHQPDHAAAWQYAGLLPIVGGLAVLVWCIWDFAVQGRGTLAPVDPPKQLVVRGLYRRVRNPMYVGVLGILAGEALLFRSPALLGWAAVFFGITHLFVIRHEERSLRRKFGESYETYCRDVGRWLPRRPRKPAGE